MLRTELDTQSRVNKWVLPGREGAPDHSRVEEWGPSELINECYGREGAPDHSRVEEWGPSELPCLYFFNFDILFGHTGSSLWHLGSLILIVAHQLLVRHEGIYFHDQGSNPGPLCWESGVLATEPPSKSLPHTVNQNVSEAGSMEEWTPVGWVSVSIAG